MFLSDVCYAFRMKKRLLLALACAFLTSCASIVGPRDIEIPLHKLQASLERRFPISNRVLELFDIELTRPQFSVLPEADRIALAMDMSIAPPFTRQSWTGKLALSGRLYIDPARNAVLMAEPRVDQFTIDEADEARQRQIARVANLLMQKAVGDTPLYHFRPEDLRYAGVQFVPTRVSATARGLLVTVEPAK